MRLDTKYHPEKAAGRDQTRLAITEPYLDKEESKLIATNGRILAAIPVDVDENDVSGYVPGSACKEARKGRGKAFALIACNGAAEVFDGASHPRMDLTFPTWKSVIPDAVDRETDTTIAFDPYLLHDLAQALGVKRGQGIMLGIKDPAAPLMVTKGEAFGVLMPMRVD